MKARYALALFLVAAPITAWAAGYPVIDSQNLTKTAESAQNLLSQVQHLKQLVGNVTDLTNAIGPKGTVDTSDMPALSLTGLAQAKPNLTGFTNPSGGAAPSTPTDLAGLKTWLNTVLFTPAASDNGTVERVRRNRANLVALTAVHAAALSQHALDHSSADASRAATRAAAANNALTLRKAIAVNTNAVMADYEVSAYALAVEASALALEAANIINGLPTTAAQ